MGGDLPENLLPGSEENPKGYFEPQAIVERNDVILRAMGREWFDVGPTAFTQEDLAVLRAQAAPLAETLASEYGSAALPIIKDPRISVLLPAWKEVTQTLPGGAAFIVAYRHPAAVSKSLGQRNDFTPFHCVALWLHCLLRAEIGTRGLKRAFVNANTLVSDPIAELGRLGRVLDLPLNADRPEVRRAIAKFIEPELLHPSGATPSVLSALAENVFRQLEVLSQTPDNAEALARLDELRADFDAVAPFMAEALHDLARARGEQLRVNKAAAKWLSRPGKVALNYLAYRLADGFLRLPIPLPSRVQDRVARTAKKRAPADLIRSGTGARAKDSGG
jgi:hypothetical protein